MIHRLLNLTARSALTIASFLIAGCTAIPQPGPATPSSPVPLRLAQVGYGLDAEFEACRTDVCPRRTPKTLPAAGTSQGQGLARPLPDGHIGGREESRRPSALADPPVEGAPIQQTDVQFAFASARLGPHARQALRALAPRLAQARHIKLSGRTDSTGPADVNERLAKARAEAVLRELLILSPGIAPITTVVAQGACCYAQSNDSAAGRARNRRVEIRYRLDKDVPP